MIKLKCHCGSEVEVDFSRAAVAYEKETNYANSWLETHNCKQTGGFITAPPTNDNNITLTPNRIPDAGPVVPQSPKLPIIWCEGSGTLSVPGYQGYTTINYNIQNSAGDEEPPDISLKV